MGTRERIRILRLIHKIRANPGYANALGITVAETHKITTKKGT